MVGPQSVRQLCKGEEQAMIVSPELQQALRSTE